VLQIEISRRKQEELPDPGMYAAIERRAAQGQMPTMPSASSMLRGQDDLFTAGNDLQDFLARKTNEPSEGIAS